MRTDEQPRRIASIAYRGGFLVFLAVAVFFLWTEHRAHFLGALPYAIVLLCPLMSSQTLYLHR
jgi:hypothetical protein